MGIRDSPHPIKLICDNDYNFFLIIIKSYILYIYISFFKILNIFNKYTINSEDEKVLMKFILFYFLFFIFYFYYFFFFKR